MTSDSNLIAHPLREWAEYFLHVSTAGVFRDSRGKHEFSFGLPNGKKLNVVADTPDQLAKKVMVELTNTLASPPSTPERTQNECCSSADSQGRLKETTTMHCDDSTLQKAAKTYTKAKQVTVGVNSSRAMYDVINDVARKRGVSSAVLTRELVEQTLERFYVQSDIQSPRQLFETYEKKLRCYEGASYQWMARLDHDLGMDIKLTAQEYRKSASQIVGYFVAEGLSHCIEAQDLQNQPCSKEELTSALTAIEPFNGRRAGDLAKDVGLGRHRILMNQVLVGAVNAPRRVIESLADRLGVSARSLSQAFELRFLQSYLPSFSAPDGEPTVCASAKSWREGVEALQLSKEEEQELLALED